MWCLVFDVLGFYTSILNFIFFTFKSLSAKREKSKSLKNIEERENTLMTIFQPLKKLTLVSMCSSLREEFNKSIVALNHAGKNRSGSIKIFFIHLIFIF
jgi:hypothetical protein